MHQAVPEIHDLDDVMIYGILSGAKTESVSRLSLEIVSALSAMAKDTTGADYRHGINIGRKLFRMASAPKHYSWYGEAIPDLVSFMEKSGYDAVTYKMLPFSVSVKVHQRAHDMGFKAHTFEAGLISGFLTAAQGQLVHVSETKCASDGAEYCDFVTSEATPSSSQSVSSDKVYGTLQKELSGDPSMKREYYALATSGMSDALVGALRASAFAAGSEIGRRIAAEHGGRGATTESVLRVIRTAYPGAISVKRVSPTNVRVSFDKMSSRKGVVELMRSFVEGIVSAALGVENFGGAISATKDNSYSMTVRIK